MSIILYSKTAKDYGINSGLRNNKKKLNKKNTLFF